VTTGAALQPESVDPSRLARLVGEATAAAGGLLLCSDFDGSLAPITDRPAEAMALPEAARALAWLSRAGAALGRAARWPTRVAVITGRDSDDVLPRAALGPEAVVVGNYGLERSAGGRLRVDRVVADLLPRLDGAAAEIAGLLAAGRCPGARLERKRGGVVLHTRGVDRPAVHAEALELGEEVAARWRLQVVTGKCAVELRPPLHRDKGTSLRSLRRGRWASAAVCVAGDDDGDIPMLRVAGELPVPTVTVAVADPETPEAVFQWARWRLDGPPAWAATLTGIVTLLQG
jgi:trehalose-phosphatase